MRPLLDQALHVDPSTRRIWLKNLTKAQRESLQSQMNARAAELGITLPTTMTAVPEAPRVTKGRYNSIRSGSFIDGKRAIKVGRHVVLIPAASRWKRVRDTAAYVYHRGIVSGYRAEGAKLRKLTLDSETKAHLARTLFGVGT